MRINTACKLFLFGLFYLNFMPAEAQSGGFVNAADYGFSAKVTEGKGKVKIDSDLTRLKE